MSGTETEEGEKPGQKFKNVVNSKLYRTCCLKFFFKKHRYYHLFCFFRVFFVVQDCSSVSERIESAFMWSRSMCFLSGDVFFMALCGLWSIQADPARNIHIWTKEIQNRKIGIPTRIFHWATPTIKNFRHRNISINSHIWSVSMWFWRNWEFNMAFIFKIENKLKLDKLNTNIFN